MQFFDHCARSRHWCVITTPNPRLADRDDQDKHAWVMITMSPLTGNHLWRHYFARCRIVTSAR
jgi:hypothetical protein